MGIKRYNSSGRLFWLAFWSIAWFSIATILWSLSGIVDTQIDKLLKYAELSPLKLDREMIKTLFNGFGTILLGIGPAVVFWYYRDKTIHINHDHTERDLQVKERDLKIKEDNDAWANFIKYQELAEDESISEGRRAAAIYALGEYYRRGGTQFPQQVHVFFKKYLDKHWAERSNYDCYLTATENYLNSNRYDNSSEKDMYIKARNKLLDTIPEYIKAVHETIRTKSNEKIQVTGKALNLFNYKNKLDLSEFNLTGAELASADLTQAMLYGANLTKANLEASNLTEANLELACLTGTNFERANLDKVNLYGANLDGANFLFAILTEVNFQHATMSKTNPTPPSMNKTNFTASNLKGTSLYKLNLTGISLNNAWLPESNLVEANLTAADLYNVNLKKANLRNANLTAADLNFAHLEGANLENSNLTDANLESADLSGTKLSGVNLSRAELSDSYYINSTQALKKIIASYRRGLRWKKDKSAIKYSFKMLFSKYHQPDFKNAKYDKNTKFPKWLDPKKAGMLDVTEKI